MFNSHSTRSGHDLKPRRKRVASSVSSSDSGDGLDNINFNNAVTMIYNPAERASSGPSIASRFDNGAGVITRYDHHTTLMPKITVF